MSQPNTFDDAELGELVDGFVSDTLESEPGGQVARKQLLEQLISFLESRPKQLTIQQQNGLARRLANRIENRWSQKTPTGRKKSDRYYVDVKKKLKVCACDLLTWINYE